MPQKPKLELLLPPQTSRPIIRVSGIPLTPAAINSLDGVSTSEVKPGYWLLYISRGRDSESVCQAVEKTLGVFRS